MRKEMKSCVQQSDGMLLLVEKVRYAIALEKYRVVLQLKNTRSWCWNAIEMGRWWMDTEVGAVNEILA
jgi:hypothetical protein